jgi:GLPGLI family protein
MDFENMLVFTGTESIYKNIESEETEVNFEEENNRHMKMMKKRMAPANDIIYTNMESGEVVSKKDFMDKVFLIKDSISSSRWKLSGETKVVSGMNCMKADYIPVASDSTDTLEMFVWFTPEIPVSSGPAGYGGLPGLIVYINIEDGQREISLSKIVMREVEEKEIVKPKKGKVVSGEEFEEIKRKKMEEQRKNWEGSGGSGRHF